MAVVKEYEVVSISALTNSKVRVGIAPKGRIADYSQRPVDVMDRGVVGADSQVDWDAEDMPVIGESITVTYDRNPIAATTSRKG